MWCYRVISIKRNRRIFVNNGHVRFRRRRSSRLRAGFVVDEFYAFRFVFSQGYRAEPLAREKKGRRRAIGRPPSNGCQPTWSPRKRARTTRLPSYKTRAAAITYETRTRAPPSRVHDVLHEHITIIIGIIIL